MNSFSHKIVDDKLQVELHSSSPLIMKISLGILLLVGTLGFLASLFALNSSKSMANVAIAIAIYGLVVAYLSRLFLWNSYGKEILQFKKDTLDFQYDYWLFSSDIEQLEFTDFLFQIITDNDEVVQGQEALDSTLANQHWKTGFLKLQLDQEEYLSVIKLKKEELMHLKEIITQYIGNVKSL